MVSSAVCSEGFLIRRMKRRANIEKVVGEFMCFQWQAGSWTNFKKNNGQYPELTPSILCFKTVWGLVQSV